MTHEGPGPPGPRPTGCIRSAVSGQRSASGVVVFALELAVLLWSDFSKPSPSLNILHSTGSIYQEGLLSLKENGDLRPTMQDAC